MRDYTPPTAADHLASAQAALAYQRTPKPQMTRAERLQGRLDCRLEGHPPEERIARSFFVTEIVDDLVVDAKVDVHRWGPISYEGSGNRIREIRVTLGSNPWGYLSFKEIRIADADGLWEDCDAESNELEEFASILSSSWDDIEYEVADYGTVVLFARAWIDPAFTNAPWAAIAQTVIEQASPKQAVIMLKAFPLEYEGKGKQVSFPRRLSAMKRHYGHQLGVKPIEGKHGEDGWMYRIRDGLLLFMTEPASGAGDDDGDD